MIKDLRGETARLRNIQTHNATVVPTLGTVKKKATDQDYQAY